MAVEGKRRCYHSARDGPRCASCRQLIKSFIEEGVKLAAKHVEEYFEGENRDSDPLQRIYPFLYFDRIIFQVARGRRSIKFFLEINSPFRDLPPPR